jgi:hypothetical protein
MANFTTCWFMSTLGFAACLNKKLQQNIIIIPQLTAANCIGFVANCVVEKM